MKTIKKIDLMNMSEEIPYIINHNYHDLNKTEREKIYKSLSSIRNTVNKSFNRRISKALKR